MHTVLQDHPKLKKFIKKFPAKTYLFKQGQSGSTMLLLIEGMVELIAEKDGLNHVTELVEAGGFMGEKAITSRQPYNRYYSARAKQDCVVLEISSQDLEFLKITLPEVMTQLMTKAFEVAARRLQRMNFLVNALRSSNNEERFYQCVVYFCRATGTEVPGGYQVPLSVEGICHYTDIEPKVAEKRLKALEAAKLIEKLPNDYYFVSNIQAISDYK